MDETIRNYLTRRAFLQRTGAAGLAVAAAPLLTQAGRVVAQDSRELRFNAWEFQPDAIRGHLDAWTAGSGVPVDLSLIPNVGYGPALQIRLQGGEVIDVFYNFTYFSGKFVESGWANNVADMPGATDMLDDMFPPSRARHLLPDGQMVSAPYFSAVHLLHYNEKLLADNGFSGPPASFQELYDQSQSLKTAGVRNPYVAYWIKEFCEEYLMAYLLAEGVTPFDDAGDPVFADDPASLDVLEWWNAMFQDGLTSPTMLTDDPIALSVMMGNGEAAFYTLHHYFLKIIKDLEDAPEAENVTLAYRSPGKDGGTFQMGEVIQMGTQSEGVAQEEAWDLMKFYGWRDANGELATFKSWAAAAALAAPYPDFFTDPEVQASFGDSYDFPALSDVFENKSQVVGTRSQGWYQPFQVQVGDRCHAMLLGQATPAETLKGLADDAMAAKSGGAGGL